MRKRVLVLLLFLMMAFSDLAVAKAEKDVVPNSTYQSWQKKRSYYALLEIVDAHVDPYTETPMDANGNMIWRITKRDVEKYLGKKRVENFENAGPDKWIYSSDRHGLPFPNYLVIDFEKGTVRGVSWVQGKDSASPPKRAGAKARKKEDLVPRSTYERWRKTRSFYALLEIVDVHLNPASPYFSRPDKKEVERLIGKKRDEEYPHAGPDEWVYQADRYSGMGDILLLSFKNGTPSGVGWVSE